MKKAILLGLVAFTLSNFPTSRAGELADQFDKAKKDGHLDRKMAESREKPDNHGITEIAIERSACYGTCPVYTFTLKSDGTIKYHGDEHVQRVGDFTGKINPWAFSRLAEFIHESDYVHLADEYDEMVTDSATVYTSVVIDGKRKTISNYANAGPGKLWAIERVIDSMLADVEWDAPPATQSTK